MVLAAHNGGCKRILTFNLDDFPAAALGQFQPPLAAIHRDASCCRC